MEARDTVMDDKEMVQTITDNPSVPMGQALIEKQAEISLKAGRKEVVELINSHPSLHEGDLSSTERMRPLSELHWWQAKLKEWEH